MNKGVWVRFADFILFFLMKMKQFGLTETKLFHFQRIFKNGRAGRFKRTLSGSATDKNYW